MSRHPDDPPVWKVIALTIIFILICGAAGFGLLLLTRMAHAAGPSSKWGHDEATSEWFRNLHSPQGFPCCDYADGTRIEDPGDYHENNDGSYDVKVGTEWVHVPKERVVTVPNRVGYAILWMSPDTMNVFCFMPGART